MDVPDKKHSPIVVALLDLRSRWLFPCQSTLLTSLSHFIIDVKLLIFIQLLFEKIYGVGHLLYFILVIFFLDLFCFQLHSWSFTFTICQQHVRLSVVSYLNIIESIWFTWDRVWFKYYYFYFCYKFHLQLFLHNKMLLSFLLILCYEIFKLVT